MNGRAYDYNTGRFLSVDPFIQSPTNSQSINPYSYIMNNPLSGTDPTGYVACSLDDPASCIIDAKEVGFSEVDIKDGSGNIVGTFKFNGDSNNSKGQSNVTLPGLKDNVVKEKDKVSVLNDTDSTSGDSSGYAGRGLSNSFPGTDENSLTASLDLSDTQDLGSDSSLSLSAKTKNLDVALKDVNARNTVLKITGIRDATELAGAVGDTVRHVDDLIEAAHGGDSEAYNKVVSFMKESGISVSSSKFANLARTQVYNKNRLMAFQRELLKDSIPLVIGEYISLSASSAPKGLAYGLEMLGYAVNVSSELPDPIKN